MAHKRTRTGCWTCREAGYKCDEQKPFCGRCMRLKITCKGYGVKLKWQDDAAATPGKPPRQTRRKKATNGGSTTSPLSTIDFSSPSSFSTSPSTSLVELVTSPGSVHSLPLISVPTPSIGPDLSAEDKWLLHYWVEQLSSMISMVPRRGQNSPFQKHLTSMAYDSAPLRSTLLSMAANHLAQASDDTNLRWQGFRHQRNAIHELQHILQDPKQIDIEPALATVLMMQVSMRLFGDEDDAHVANHLMGAKAMIAGHGLFNAQNAPTSIQFLLSLFAYHDILSSVSRGARPLADHSFNFSAVEGDADLQGIANILLIVARISQLQNSIKERRISSGNFPLTEEEDAMGRQLQQVLLTMDLSSPDIISPDRSDISSTAEAYRHAAFIYLYRTWLDVGAPNPISVEHVQRCLLNIEQVDSRSPLTSSHVWPLFTAGCEAIDDPQRQFVRVRFDEMYTSKRFPSLRRVMRDIEDVWAAKDMENVMEGQDGMAKVDCIQVILRKRGREVDLA